MQKPVSKLVIAIDLDEVIAETAPRIIDYYNDKYGTNVQLAQYYDWNPTIWNVDSLEIVSKRLNAFLETDEYKHLPPVEEAISAIRYLKRKYDLFIITGRPDFVEEATRRWVEKNFPDIFEDVLFANFFLKTKRGKGDICTQIGATYLIDDHLEHISHASERGVRGLLFGDLPWNISDNLPDNVTRVANWTEVLEYFDEQG